MLFRSKRSRIYISVIPVCVIGFLIGFLGAVLGIGGSDDLASPPDLVRATTALVPGSRYVEIENAGHLPCVEKPDAFTGHLVTFLKEGLHV